ncbi:hypothetical protein GCM10009727_40880 [Actinomadura napierensis]|uniref:Uncharacterized protein n=1 Tax=Actinomadura napierensis TaxID=267854 RepID=A0ABP5L6W3_9ACTN
MISIAVVAIEPPPRVAEGSHLGREDQRVFPLSETAPQGTPAALERSGERDCGDRVGRVTSP